MFDCLVCHYHSGQLGTAVDSGHIIDRCYPGHFLCLLSYTGFWACWWMETLSAILHKYAYIRQPYVIDLSSWVVGLADVSVNFYVNFVWASSHVSRYLFRRVGSGRVPLLCFSEVRWVTVILAVMKGWVANNFFSLRYRSSPLSTALWRNP